jgi:hypothetical protein
MTVNAALFSSFSQHYTSPAWLTPVICELYGRWPDLDPATNPYASIQAADRWTLRMSAYYEVLLARRSTWRKRRQPLSSAEVLAILLHVREYNRRSKAAGIRYRDALARPWPRCRSGYLNPPYNTVAGFMARLSEHVATWSSEWCALVVNRSSSRWWHQHIFGVAQAVCYFDRRLSFDVLGRPTGSAPFDSAMVYYGHQAPRFHLLFSPYGRVHLNP